MKTEASPTKKRGNVHRSYSVVLKSEKTPAPLLALRLLTKPGKVVSVGSFSRQKVVCCRVEGGVHTAFDSTARTVQQDLHD